jgi:hypothetical protein
LNKKKFRAVHHKLSMVRPSIPPTISSTDEQQPFTYAKLDDTDDLAGARPAGMTIHGRNQLVLWQNCFIWVHDQEGKLVESVNSCSGKTILTKDWKYFFGGGGKVKE